MQRAESGSGWEGRADAIVKPAPCTVTWRSASLPLVNKNNQRVNNQTGFIGHVNKDNNRQKVATRGDPGKNSTPLARHWSYLRSEASIRFRLKCWAEPLAGVSHEGGN